MAVAARSSNFTAEPARLTCHTMRSIMVDGSSGSSGPAGD
jgi:hypothetical protein